ncbi:hypothetical protein JL100_004970 [Skermanella mucosa]|uniref:hypothetical protein n=1 Tax=Skermanella mucosa TaxID=1789672 RepID=UPI00192BE5BA|nr:hypothetical protein [Skermanella mucosa]UEM22108.1 hypothetical protein JL100_004970 [Skermanella mucosa]
MRTPTAILMAWACLALAAPGDAGAKELNQRTHLEPRFNGKIQMEIAKSWRRRGELQDQDFTQGGKLSCGSQAVGNVYVPRGATAPREVVTIITGDVINNVGRGGC